MLPVGCAGKFEIDCRLEDYGNPFMGTLDGSNSTRTRNRRVEMVGFGVAGNKEQWAGNTTTIE